MFGKNIFEVLQNIAENPESSEKFLNILKENGFTGTLEEAENQINQQTQVVLDNLTTEDLQNIAGGKSLMNDKLKKALAVGGASLMAASPVMPSGSVQGMNKVKKTVTGHANKGVDYVKKHPIHTGTTLALAAIAGTLIIKNIFQGRPSATLSSNVDLLTYLIKKDLSEGKKVLSFILLCATGKCTITVGNNDTEPTLQFTEVKDDLLKEKLWKDGNDNPEYTIDTLLEKFVSLMAEAENETYVTGQNTLTAEGAKVLNTISEPLRNLLNCVINNAKPSVKDESEEEEDEDEKANENQQAVREAEGKLTAFKENRTKLDAFIQALTKYVDDLLNKVNEMDTEDRTERTNEVKKFTEESSDAFKQAWNGFTNVEDLKTADILTDPIFAEIKKVFVEELNKLANTGSKSQDLSDIKTQIEAAIDGQFKSFTDQEIQLEEQVKKAKDDQEVAKGQKSKKTDNNIDTVTLPEAKTFNEGEPLTLKQTAPKEDKN